MMPLSLLFTACSSKEESDYVFGISNAYSLNQDDSYAVMSYVESRVDLDEDIIIKSASEQDASELAIQEFNSRLTAINDAELDTMFKGSEVVVFFIFNPVSVSVSYVHERCRFFVLHIHAGKTENDAEK